MKKIILAFVLSCFCAGVFAQANLSTVQKSFQTSIFNFLREEGYAPTLNVDSEIKFKSEGEYYWIRIFSESPFFVIMQKTGYSLSGENALNRTNSIMVCNDVNRELNAVKLYCTEKLLVFNIEQYVRSAEDFKYVCIKNLKLLADADKEFTKRYNELSLNASSKKNNE